MQVRQRGDGLIVWYDLLSTDEPVTDRFYRDLFGWEAEAESHQANGYRSFSHGGEAFGGTMPWDASMGQSSWMAYIQVIGIDAISSRAEAMGATVFMAKTEVPDVGHFVVLANPTGAPFYLFELFPNQRVTSTRYERGNGHVIWNELITNDVATASVFYREVAGWELAPITADPLSYIVARVDGEAVAGLFQPEVPSARSAWIVSFQTSDIDATIERVQELGGKVIHPANAVPDIGRTAWVADPTGAIFGLMQPESGWLQRL